VTAVGRALEGILGRRVNWTRLRVLDGVAGIVFFDVLTPVVLGEVFGKVLPDEFFREVTGIAARMLFSFGVKQEIPEWGTRRKEKNILLLQSVMVDISTQV
jgi:hypothetical protein